MENRHNKIPVTNDILPTSSILEQNKANYVQSNNSSKFIPGKYYQYVNFNTRFSFSCKHKEATHNLGDNVFRRLRICTVVLVGFGNYILGSLNWK